MTEMARNFSLEEMDKQSLIHPATSIADHLKNGPLIVSDGRGTRVRDQKGRDLIDFGAGLCRTSATSTYSARPRTRPRSVSPIAC